jgi:hypothetical protein
MGVLNGAMHRILPLLLLPMPFAGGLPATDSAAPRHVIVYQEPGRFGGWPANHGVWSWGDEILVGFCAAHYLDRGPDGHAVDPAKPEEHLLARSRDGGETWTIENPAAQGALLPRGAMLFGTPLPGVPLPELRALAEPVDFSHPDFVLTVRMDDHRGGGQSRFEFSYDRGHTWQGPFALPLFGTPGIAARTDYLVAGPRACLLFLTAGKSDGREGRTLAVRTDDGGLNWEFLGWIGPEPEGFRIMPSTVRLDDGALLTAVRSRAGARRWIETWISRDTGRTWNLHHPAVAATGRGNPPSMLRLRDGRLAVTYGYRAEPYGIRARVSADAGQSWGAEIILRADGASWDLGYPRSVQRADGRIVTVYYFHAAAGGPERYIAATIWDPGTAADCEL